MSQSPSDMDRRDFLKTGLGATAGAVALSAATANAAPGGKVIKGAGAIPTRVFGKTGHTLPVLGHGGSAMVNSWESAYGVSLGSEEERVEMVRRAYDLGVRYFDTARVYSESEGIMGRALKDHRENVYIATKVAMPSPSAARKSVETSLEHLQTDYVDCMQIHSPAIERVGAEGAMKIFEELSKLRDEGLIRFIGLTTHVAFEEVFKMIDTGNFDQVLLARGYIRKGMDTLLSNANIEWREKCVARAHELGMAIVTMKVMGLNLLGRGSVSVVKDYDEGERKKIPAAAIRWVLQDERVSMLNIGMSVMEDVEANVASIKGALKFTEADRMLLADYGRVAYASEYVKAMKIV